MTTLGALLIIFALVDFFGGSGPIAILVMGVILGNSNDFAKLLRLKITSFVDETIKFFHGEVTFFIRTFFFVYMGMMISFNSVNLHFLTLSISLILIIIVIRYISVEIITRVIHEKREDKFIMFSMMPRGLASAVLASLPLSANIKGSEVFIEYTFAVIILTNILMTAGVLMSERKAEIKNSGNS